MRFRASLCSLYQEKHLRIIPFSTFKNKVLKTERRSQQPIRRRLCPQYRPSAGHGSYRTPPRDGLFSFRCCCCCCGGGFFFLRRSGKHTMRNRCFFFSWSISRSSFFSRSCLRKGDWRRSRKLWFVSCLRFPPRVSPRLSLALCALSAAGGGDVQRRLQLRRRSLYCGGRAKRTKHNAKQPEPSFLQKSEPPIENFPRWRKVITHPTQPQQNSQNRAGLRVSLRS